MTSADTPDLGTGVNAVTIIRCEPGDAAALEAIMIEDYEYLVAHHPGFLEGRVVASSVAPGTYFHITHWASAEQFAAAGQDPEVQRIFGSLPLSAPAEGHRGGAVVWAAGGVVHRAGAA
jgi:heme-degrading monooxygenase HmoA